MWSMQGGRNAQGTQMTGGLWVHSEKDRLSAT